MEGGSHTQVWLIVVRKESRPVCPGLPKFYEKLKAYISMYKTPKF